MGLITLDVPSSVESARLSQRVVAGSTVTPEARFQKDKGGYKREYQKALATDANQKAEASVRVDNGRSRTEWDASIGIPITAETFMRRLLQLNSSFWFERANADKEKIGIYRLCEPDMNYPEGKIFICGFHDGLMPEFFLQEKEEDRVMNIGGETVVHSGGCKRILRQGYRTILQRLVRAGMINLAAAEAIFGPPSYDSAHWALLTGRRSSID
jgi:hypothetical protein